MTNKPGVRSLNELPQEALLVNLPYGQRDDGKFLRQINALTIHHLRGCPEYARIWPEAGSAARIEDVPFLHVELFKHMQFKTKAEGIRHERILKSSATTGSKSSMIMLDSYSSQLQSQSANAILSDFLGSEKQPLLILDNVKSFVQKGEISARAAAAMSLRPLADEIIFLLRDPNDPLSVDWDEFLRVMLNSKSLIIYGLTWMLWSAWGDIRLPDAVQDGIKNKKIQFVHSGGWKKLEAEKSAVNSSTAGY